ncbi:polyketide synthase dehydratase domain-containing protein [Desulfococcaceae bacterium HSG7]|nr:polyketide synthase dehydratase domain-containing protein [Desulfococcaceae bacterium HSG7]
MEKLSKIINQLRLPLKIPDASYLQDHRFERRTVLPAVEAMQILALTTKAHLPKTDIRFIRNAHFDKFLYIDSENRSINAFNAIQVDENGAIHAKLITKTGSPKTTITRVKEHVSLTFGITTPHKQPLFKENYNREPPYMISTSKLYKDLVPFGPAFQNIKKLYLYKDSAEATIKSAMSGSTGPEPLGSPFTLDAAFHAACAWGQRYADVVAFPVGFDHRRIINPTYCGETYKAQIKFVQKEKAALIFDINIYSSHGDLCEMLKGVRMRDVSAGRMKPPLWIKSS